MPNKKCVSARSNTGKAPPFQVVTIAQAHTAVRARAGVQLLPDADFDSHPRLDVLLVPGGVVNAEQAKPEVIAWIARNAAHCGLTASVWGADIASRCLYFRNQVA